MRHLIKQYMCHIRWFYYLHRRSICHCFTQEATPGFFDVIKHASQDFCGSKSLPAKSNTQGRTGFTNQSISKVVCGCVQLWEPSPHQRTWEIDLEASEYDIDTFVIFQASLWMHYNTLGDLNLLLSFPRIKASS